MDNTIALSSSDSISTSKTVSAGKPRLAMIDIAKGLGILLVVFGHNRIFFDLEPNKLGDFLGAFRLPFFFFVSGVTFSIVNRTLGDIALQRADAWLKPFAMAALIGGAFKLLVGKVTIESILLGVVYGTGFTLIWPAIWFLPHLWLLYVTTTMLLMYGGRLVDSIPKRALFLALLVTAGYFFLGLFDTPVEDITCKSKTAFDLSILHCGLPFTADILMLTGFYFLLGHFVSRMVMRFRFNLAAFVVSFAALMTLHFVFDFRIDFNQRRYDDLLISTAQALCGIYVMLCLCSWMSASQWLTRMFVYAGRGSLFILLFHMPIQYRMTDSLGLRWGEIWPVGVIGFIVAVVLPLIFWEICKRSRLLSIMFLPMRKKSARSLPATAASPSAS